MRRQPNSNPRRSDTLSTSIARAPTVCQSIWTGLRSIAAARIPMGSATGPRTRKPASPIPTAGRRLRLSASRSLSSTYAVSSSDRPRNSCAVPNFQPFASSLSCLVLRIIVFLQSPPTSVQDRGRGLGGFLGEYLRNHDCIRVNTIHDAPSGFCVYHPELVTSRTNGRHRPRVWHRQDLPPLKLSEEVARLDPRRLAEGRALHLPVEPSKRLVLPDHTHHPMSYLT